MTWFDETSKTSSHYETQLHLFVTSRSFRLLRPELPKRLLRQNRRFNGSTGCLLRPVEESRRLRIGPRVSLKSSRGFPADPKAIQSTQSIFWWCLMIFMILEDFWWALPLVCHLPSLWLLGLQAHLVTIRALWKVQWFSRLKTQTENRWHRLAFWNGFCLFGYLPTPKSKETCRLFRQKSKSWFHLSAWLHLPSSSQLLDLGPKRNHSLHHDKAMAIVDGMEVGRKDQGHNGLKKQVKTC